MAPSLLASRESIVQVEEGDVLAPQFDADGLIPCVTTDAKSGELLMHAYMNKEALVKSLTSGEAHYYSRARKILWHKGSSSGMIQKIVEMRIDDDQDCVWIRVEVGGIGASCHVGYRSCFYRMVNLPAHVDSKQGGLKTPISLSFAETKKMFAPERVYGGAPNPTKL